MKRARMRTRWPRAAAALLAAVAAILAGAVLEPAAADTSVYFEPSGVMIPSGETFELSFRIADSPDSIASFQLYLWFDPTVVELLSAEEGSLYVDSGTMTWPIVEEEHPGFWHFFNTVFGAGTYILPPGELLHLTFRALGPVQTPARIDTIRMTDIRRDALPVIGAQDAWIFVDPVGVPEMAIDAPSIDAVSPNPFAAGTTVQFSVPSGAGSWRVDIYDVTGRRVRTLDAMATDGFAGGRGSAVWDGRSDSGGELPSSVYFVRLTDGRQETRSRVVKLK